MRRNSSKHSLPTLCGQSRPGEQIIIRKVAGRSMSTFVEVAQSQEKQKAPFSSEPVPSNMMDIFRGAGHSVLSSGKHADGTAHA